MDLSSILFSSFFHVLFLTNLSKTLLSEDQWVASECLLSFLQFICWQFSKPAEIITAKIIRFFFFVNNALIISPTFKYLVLPTKYEECSLKLVWYYLFYFYVKQEAESAAETSSETGSLFERDQLSQALTDERGNVFLPFFIFFYCILMFMLKVLNFCEVNSFPVCHEHNLDTNWMTDISCDRLFLSHCWNSYCCRIFLSYYLSLC